MRTWTRAAAVVAVGLVGAVLALVVAGSTRADVGPFGVDIGLRPSLTGDTVVDVPPLGQLQLETHDGPVSLRFEVAELREEAARRIVSDPASLASLGAEVNEGVRAGLLRVVLRTVAVCVLGAALLGLVVLRSPRLALAAAGVGTLAVLGTGAAAGATFDEDSLAEPRYTGLLAVAPTAVGDVRDVVARFDAYSQSLGRLVTNVGELYAAASTLPTYAPNDDTIRVLHVSDLHLSPSSYEVIDAVVKQFGIDVVVDSGDLTDFGSEPETQFVAGIGRLDVPYVWVRGNHDSRLTQAAVRERGGIVLDGAEVVEVAGLRFLGRGDPRFTPDKSTADDDTPASVLERLGDQLLAEAASSRPDVVVVHDARAAERVLGAVPLVLAGHTHERRSATEETEDGTSLLLVQGSTGGAGLRSLEGDEPTAVQLSVLYLDPDTAQVQAYDDITLGGLGLSSARIERTVVDNGERVPEPAAAAD